MRSRTMSRRVRATCAAAAAVILPMVGMSVGTQSVAASRASVRTIQKGATVQFAAAAPGGTGFTTGEIPAPDLENRAGNRPSGAAPRAAAPLAATPAAAPSSNLVAQTSASKSRLKTSFEGLNHRAQRLANGGNQFSLEPPDQGMCVNAKYVLETVNDVTRVYNKDGTPASGVVDLNTFYGYPAQVNRTTGAVGPFVTDPSCLYDHATQRWFMVVLTLEIDPGTGGFAGPNHLDIAVSQTPSPIGAWNIYRLPVQDDGTAGTPNHGCSGGPCIGDYPHIGAEANGFYITTNEYSFSGAQAFHGAQIYAFSKAALAQGASSVSVTQFDTHGLDRGNSGFTIWPAQSPGEVYETAAGGTEYFLSSNAADEAHGDGTLKGPRQSTEILTWALTNTSSLIGGNPQPFLSMTHLGVNLYATPPAANQKLTGPFPLMKCFNTPACATKLLGGPDRFLEVPSTLDSNDTRMQQVTFAHGLVWGALDTAITVNHEVKAGIEWFTVKPSLAGGSVSGAVHSQGYLGLAGNNLTYPAIGVTRAGKAAIGFTIVGNDYFPSAGYARLSSSTGAGPVEVAALGTGPQDGFSGYKAEGNPPGTTRPRWGDYGAAAPDGNSIWLASEYIGQSCTFAQYTATPFGSCNGTRTALANWDTRISQVVVQ